MKAKIIQILLGTAGSILAVIASSFVNVPGDVALVGALGAGPVTTLLLSEWATTLMS